MVVGLDKFKDFFQEYNDNYLIIGGSACDIIIEGGGFTPRATDDIDLILIVEALSPEFVKQFWDFVAEGLSNLSAILLDEDYYRYTVEHSTIEDNVHFANTEALICLKAYAYLDNKTRKEQGVEICNQSSSSLYKYLT